MKPSCSLEDGTFSYEIKIKNNCDLPAIDALNVGGFQFLDFEQPGEDVMDSATFEYKSKYTKILLDGMDFDTSAEFRTLEIVFGECHAFWPLDTRDEVCEEKSTKSNKKSFKRKR